MTVNDASIGRFWHTVTATVGAVLLFTGCAGGAVPTQNKEDTAALFGDAVADARQGGAGPEQLAQLETAQTSQEVSLEDMREAARRAVDCMTDTGVEATYKEEQLPWGLTLPGYVVTLPEESQEVSSDGSESCALREFHWVSMLYQLQPSSQALRVKAVAEGEDIIRRCLEESGHEAPADATPVELGDFAADVGYRTHGAVDCLMDAGVTSW